MNKPIVVRKIKKFLQKHGIPINQVIVTGRSARCLLEISDKDKNIYKITLMITSEFRKSIVEKFISNGKARSYIKDEDVFLSSSPSAHLRVLVKVDDLYVDKLGIPNIPQNIVVKNLKSKSRRFSQ